MTNTEIKNPIPRVPERANEGKTAEQIVDEQFFTAQSGRKADATDKLLIADIEEKVKSLARTIVLDVPPGRNRSTALTKLEDVQMRAIRAIFSPVG